MNEPILIDAHEDLAWNILTFRRDYSRSVAETRRLEVASLAAQVNGDTLLGWPEYQHGKVAIVFSTIFAAPERHKLGPWDEQCYRSVDEAHLRYQQQIEAYERLVGEHPDMFQKIETQADLESVLAHWQREDTDKHPVGLVRLMEGAEGVRELAELEQWYRGGVRIIGPAWAGTRFCGGTHEPGGLTDEGRELIDRIAAYHFSLDISHMDEKAALESLDAYQGPVIASHANALALLKGSDSNRHLTDRVIEGILERDGIIGIVPANSFLRPGWKEAGGRDLVTLDYFISQIDYICQLAGNARHVGIGSDFDGGFGLQSVPHEIDSIADLRKIIPLLAQRGYTEVDMASILNENWLAHLKNNLPEVV
jgi:membrane dipeptidase